MNPCPTCQSPTCSSVKANGHGGNDESEHCENCGYERTWFTWYAHRTPEAMLTRGLATRQATDSGMEKQ